MHVILPTNHHISQNTEQYSLNITPNITHVFPRRGGHHTESSVSFLPWGMYVQVPVRKPSIENFISKFR